MQLLSLRALLFLIVLGFGVSVHATETSTLNASVRGLGMGDAFTAVADDSSALFYNPAGLAQVRGLNWKVFDLYAGESNYQTFQSLEKAAGGSSSSVASTINSAYGDHAWLGAGGESFMSIPGLAFGVYDHGGALIQIDNPVYPQVHTRVIDDFGYAAGIGLPILPMVNVGFDLKYIKRTGTDTTYGPGSLADLSTSTIQQSVTNWGTGYAADLGATFVVPAPLFKASFSAAWKNIGQTQFTSPGGSAIPSDENNVTLGAALRFDTLLVSVIPAVDFIYLNDANLQFTRKINMGVEIQMPLLDIRGGFHEGYYTAGLGVKLGLFRVDAATYGVELGDYPGQLEDRRYVVQLTMELGVGDFSLGDKSNSSSSSSSSGTSGGSGSSNSIWGGSSLKQRR